MKDSGIQQHSALATRENVWENIRSGKKLHLAEIISRQWKQIQQGGVGVWCKKFWMMLMVVLALPVALIIRLVRPFILIRFGDLNATRLGHFATNTALYTAYRHCSRSNTLDIFYYTTPISNHQMKKMWDRTLLICPLARWWEKANMVLPGAKAHIIREHLDGRDARGVYEKSPIPVSFSADEEKQAQEALGRLGLPKGAFFVCFHARSPVYLDKYLPQFDHRYHDFRDSDIMTYQMAVQELIRRGYYCIRMGMNEPDPFPLQDPKLIDYAILGRDELLDIYLPAKCHFFLGTACGLTSIPRLFKRPIAWVNYIPLSLAHSWDSRSYFIPKKIWLKSEKRFLNFKEMLSPPWSNERVNINFEEAGIEPVNNTPQEIADLAREVEERLGGRWKASSQDEAMQEKFWSLFRKDRIYHDVIRARIGTQFLRDHQHLLEA